MRALSLLFDPRGAIDRATFWSGLAQLTIVSLAVSFGLSRLGLEGELAALPVAGEAYAISDVAKHVYWGLAPDVALTASILIVAARYYVALCLMLKRSRHAGLGLGPVIAFGVTGGLVHGAMGFWACQVFGEGMAVIVPGMADIVANTLIWTVFMGWIGTLPTEATKRGAARRDVHCAG